MRSSFSLVVCVIGWQWIGLEMAQRPLSAAAQIKLIRKTTDRSAAYGVSQATRYLRDGAHATALAICAHTSPACGPCAREIKIAPFHTWGYEGRPWTSNDCAQASHTRKNARAHDFSQKRCDAYDRSRPPVNAARTHFAPRDSCRPYIQHVRYASITYNTV